MATDNAVADLVLPNAVAAHLNPDVVETPVLNVESDQAKDDVNQSSADGGVNSLENEPPKVNVDGTSAQSMDEVIPPNAAREVPSPQPEAGMSNEASAQPSIVDAAQSNPAIAAAATKAEELNFDKYMQMVWDIQDRWTVILKEANEAQLMYARSKFDKRKFAQKYRETKDLSFMEDCKRMEKQLVESARRLEALKVDRVKILRDEAVRKEYMERLNACPDAKDSYRLPREFWGQAEEWELCIRQRQEQKASDDLKKAFEEEFGGAAGLKYGEKDAPKEVVGAKDRKKVAAKQ